MSLWDLLVWPTFCFWRGIDKQAQLSEDFESFEQLGLVEKIGDVNPCKPCRRQRVYVPRLQSQSQARSAMVQHFFAGNSAWLQQVRGFTLCVYIIFLLCALSAAPHWRQLKLMLWSGQVQRRWCKSVTASQPAMSTIVLKRCFSKGRAQRNPSPRPLAPLTIFLIELLLAQQLGDYQVESFFLGD